MPEHLMNTKEVAKYLNIHEKQVYQLIKTGKIPCTRVTGKWIFPLDLIDEWIQSSAKEGYQRAKKNIEAIDGALLASGSNDPVLDMLMSAIRKDHPDFQVFAANTGSVAGLEALNTGMTDVAFSHLYDEQTGDYNVPFLKRYCPDQSPVVVNLFHRQIGFVVTRSASQDFHGWDDLTNPSLHFINRQSGSGIRLIIDRQLERLGIEATEIIGYENEVYTHFEVGLSLIEGEAHVGIASAAVAKILDLTFIPLHEERFDMVLSRNTFFQPPVQAFIETLQSDVFRHRVAKIGSYDFRASGRVVHS